MWLFFKAEFQIISEHREKNCLDFIDLYIYVK